jgi:hypothetical protein
VLWLLAECAFPRGLTITSSKNIVQEHCRRTLSKNIAEAGILLDSEDLAAFFIKPPLWPN